MFAPSLLRLAESILDDARARTLCIATAESCTGGLIGGLLTEIAGSSHVFERGFIVYSNLAKTEMLGVPASLIEADGAVSESVARAMAEGAIARSQAQLAVAVTGIAGPTGGTAEKPVGLVHIAATREAHATLHEVHRFGEIGRAAIRMKTVEAALEMLRRLI